MRRTMDVIAASLVLAVSLPALALAAAAIRMEGPGSVFYRSDRVGQGRRIFKMWKLRTMVPGAHALGPSVTAGHDPRITRVGRLLRRAKLDEIPQFWNVLVGDMTLVGPRPEAPDLAARYSPSQQRILAFKPGVTSPGTLRYAREDEATFPPDRPADEYYLAEVLDPKIEADLEYLGRRTIGSDLGVMLQTVRFILGKALPS